MRLIDTPFWRFHPILLRESWTRRVDKFWMDLAWMLPRRLVLWCFVRVHAHATSGKWGHELVDTQTYSTVYTRWMRSNEDTQAEADAALNALGVG